MSNQIILNHQGIFEQMQDALRKNIDISKQKYYFKFSRKLAGHKINPKCYWSILKSFLNDKRIPSIPPLKLVSAIYYQIAIFHQMIAL